MNKFRSLYVMGICLFIIYPFVYGGNNIIGKKVLVIGLNDNVRSNYYYDKMIAEETGMAADSIDVEYNRAIVANMIDTSQKLGCEFVSAETCGINCGLIEQIKVTGEEENCISDLSDIHEDDLQKILYQANADYLLVLNQHYLKYQDRPMQTVFLFVSYSLFDKEKNEILSDNYYFTCMNPEDSEKVKKISRKSTSKMASSLLKTLDRELSLFYK